MRHRATRRISANPHANGGLLRKELELPDFRNYAVKVKAPGAIYAPPTDVLAHFLAEVMRRNMSTFRVFGPDETASNRLTAIYAASKKTWLAEYKPEDADGGELDVSGRVMEMLSEHTLEGWFEGYVLTGRHGFFSTYEAFVHVIDSMFNQHAKWLEKSKKELDWRAPVPSINILITSLVWRQDHNGFTHQDPGISRRGHQQEPRTWSASICRRTRTACSAWPIIACAPATTSTSSSRTSRSICSTSPWKRP